MMMWNWNWNWHNKNLVFILCLLNTSNALSSKREIKSTACEDILKLDDVFVGIIVTDDIWKNVDQSLQRLVDCLPNNPHNTLIFNTTIDIIPVTTTYIENMYITITSWNAYMNRLRSSFDDFIEFQCPSTDDNHSFLNIQNSNVIINNIRIANCKSDKDYVINVNGNVTIQNSIMKNFKQNIINVMDNGRVDIVNSQFYKNGPCELISSSSKNYNEKITSNTLSNTKITITIYNTRFRGNQAKLNEGLLNINNGNITFYNSFFYYNNGSIINVHNSNLILNKCAFDYNIANDNSIIISKALDEVYYYNLLVIESKFENSRGDGNIIEIEGIFNTLNVSLSQFESNVFQERGSTIYVSNASLNITKSKFVKNLSLKDKGSSLHAESIEMSCNIFISESNFESNEAEKGGSMYIKGHFNSILLDQLILNENKAIKDGGVILISEISNITISNSEMKSNTATNGAVIYIKKKESDSHINITSNSMDSNKAHELGGAIYIRDSPNVTIEKVLFKDNFANVTGGAIYAITKQKSTLLTIACSYFKMNHANVTGGAINLSGSNLTAIIKNNTNFENNKSDKRGGALFLEMAPDVFITSSTFESNIANEGGSISFNNSDLGPAMKIEDSVFKSNTAKKLGSCLHTYTESELTNKTHIQDNSVMIKNVTFNDNESQGSGGVIYAQNMPFITIENSKFYRNNAYDNGGAITFQNDDYNETLYFSFYTIYFENNTARNGGSMYCNGLFKTKEFFDVNFFQNTCHLNGGSLYAQNGLKIQGSNITFIKNTAISENSNGGAIYFKNDNNTRNELILKNSIFEDNEAYAMINPFNIENVTFDNNGGVIYSEGSSLFDFENCLFYDNECPGHGGCLYLIEDTELIIKNSKFENNICLGSGGSLYLTNSENDIKIEDSCFVENFSQKGGSSYFKNVSNIKINGCEFEYNHAFTDGGSIYNEDCYHFEIENSLFENNKAIEKGGSINFKCGTEIDAFSSNCMMKIFNSTFKNNEIFDKDIIYNNMLICDYLIHGEIMAHGGAICAMGAPIMLNITNSSFIDNLGVNGGSLYTKDLETLEIINSEFIENKGICGGSIFSVNTNFKLGDSPYNLTENTFEDNMACKGGAMIFFDNQQQEDTDDDDDYNEIKLLLIDNEFFNNEAQVSGGILHLNHTHNTLLYCTNDAVDNQTHNLQDVLSNDSSYCNDKIKGNKVTTLNGHGNMFSTDALYRKVNKNEIINYTSGNIFPVLEIKNLDGFEQRVPESELFANITGNVNITGQTSTTLTRGIGIFETIIVYDDPGDYNLTILFSNTYYEMLNISLNIRKCKPGEIYNINKECIKCSNGYYSFDPNDATCHKCPKNAVCNESVIVPENGYWHGYIESEYIKKCIMESVCTWDDRIADLQFYSSEYISSKEESDSFSSRKLFQLIDENNTYSYNLQCLPGYHGVLCGSCDDKHFRISGYKCKSCNNHITGIISLLCIALLLFLYSYILLKSSWSIGKKDSSSTIPTDGTHGHSVFRSVVNQSNHSELQDSPVLSKVEPQVSATVTEPEDLQIQKSLELPVVRKSTGGRKSMSARGSSLTTCEISEMNENNINGQEIRISDQQSNASEADVSPKDITIKVLSSDRSRNISFEKVRLGLLNEAIKQETENLEKKKAYLSESFKALLNFVQITSMALFINTNWNKSIEMVYKIFDVIGIGGDSSISLDCILEKESRITPISIRRYAILNIYPFFIVILFMLLWTLSGILVHHSFQYTLQRYAHSFFIVIYISYIHLTHRALRMFSCTQVLNQSSNTYEYVWLEDTDILCYQNTHKNLSYILGIFTLSFISVIYPIIALIASYNRENLRTVAGFRQYGFLTNAYKHKTRCWELLIFIRKLGICAIVAFGYNLGPDLQAILASGLLATFLLIHLLFSPYKKSASIISNMETVSLFGSFIAFYSVAIADNPRIAHKDQQSLFLTLSIILIIIFSYLFSQTLNQLSASLSWSLSKMGIKIDDDMSLLNKMTLAFFIEIKRLRLLCLGLRKIIHNSAKKFSNNN